MQGERRDAERDEPRGCGRRSRRRRCRRRFIARSKRLDPSLPIVRLQTMDDVFADAIGRPRLLAQLLGVFAELALLLAAIGAYGVLSAW